MVFSKILNSLPTGCKSVLSIDIDSLDIIYELARGRKLFCIFTFESHDRKNLDFPNKLFHILGKERLPFEDKEFDLIIGDKIFSHVLSLSGALNEFRRLLKDQGLIITVEPNIQYVKYFFKLINNEWENILGDISPKRCHYFFTMKSFSRFASENGFKVDACYPIEVESVDVYPRNSEGYIAMDRYKLGPLSDTEYLEFLTKKFIVLLSKTR